MCLFFDRPTFLSDKADFGENASGPSSQEFIIFKIAKGSKKIKFSWINYSTYWINQTSQAFKHKTTMTLNS